MQQFLLDQGSKTSHDLTPRRIILINGTYIIYAGMTKGGYQPDCSKASRTLFNRHMNDWRSDAFNWFMACSTRANMKVLMVWKVSLPWAVSSTRTTRRSFGSGRRRA